MSLARSCFPPTLVSILQVDSAPETASEHPEDSVWVPSNNTPCPDGATSTGGDTLPDLEVPKGPSTDIAIEDSTEEAALLTGGGQEVSGLDTIFHKEEDNLLSSMPQESSGKTPIEGASLVVSESSSQFKLIGSPPMNGADHPAESSASIKAPEGTMTPTLTQEHQAEVYSSALDVEVDAKALTAACGLVPIKLELLDPKPMTFTGELRVIDDELEIIDLCQPGRFPMPATM